MASRELNRTQIRALGIPSEVSDKQVFTGLAEIAAFMGTSISTVRRRIRMCSLPGVNFTGQPGNRVIITRDLLIEWNRRYYAAQARVMGWPIHLRSPE